MTRRPVKLQIFGAFDLPVSDWDTGVSDPYLMITMVDERGKQIFMHETAVHEETLNPVFNENVLLPGMHTKCKIVFTAIDKDDIRDQFLGQAVWEIETIREGLLFLEGDPEYSGLKRLEFGDRQYTPTQAGSQPVSIDFGGKHEAQVSGRENARSGAILGGKRPTFCPLVPPSTTLVRFVTSPPHRLFR